jgi:hypothetical protein
LAVNEYGYESGVAAMSLKGDLPILQDTTTDDVGTSWSAAWRDVIVLDADNIRFDLDPTGSGDAFNLTTYNLADEANREALKALLVEAASL